MYKLNSKQLRDIPISKAKDYSKSVKRKPIYFILENIYDTYNIGGIFRLADALSVSKIYICGETETPPNHKIQKASVGTYKIVPWEYKSSAVEAIEELKANPKSLPCRQAGEIRNKKQISKSKRSTKPSKNITIQQSSNSTIQIIAIEQSKVSIPYTKAEYSTPLALVVGNETYGVTPEILESVDQIVEIPMWGINKSLNVIVSAAIVGYYAVERLSQV